MYCTLLHAQSTHVLVVPICARVCVRARVSVRACACVSVCLCVCSDANYATRVASSSVSTLDDLTSRATGRLKFLNFVVLERPVEEIEQEVRVRACMLSADWLNLHWHWQLISCVSCLACASLPLPTSPPLSGCVKSTGDASRVVV